MADFHKQPSLEIKTLKNINVYIDGEGLKRKRLAKRLGMSDSNFSDYLNGKRSNVLDFAIRLAEVLGLEETFFINPDFHYQPIDFNDQKDMAFSSGALSKEGEAGLYQLLRVCDLIETYDMGDDTNARTYIQ